MREGIFGLLGVLLGGGLTYFLQKADYDRRTRRQRERDEGRKALLRQMLDKVAPDGWRNMKTLSSVIGADRDETARLLIDIGARASETGSDSWAYIKHKPLPEGD